MAIIGISVGFYTGLRSASPSMIETAQQYFDSQHLSDVSILSTVGFDDQDVDEVMKLNCVEQAMPSYQADLIITQDSADSVVRVHSLPQKTDTNTDILNEPILVDGRLPVKDNECVIESYYLKMAGYKIGDTIRFNESVEGTKTTNFIKNLEYKIVGVVNSPLYLSFSRGMTTVGNGSVLFYMMVCPSAFSLERYTNIYLQTEASKTGLSSFDDEYRQRVAQDMEQIKRISGKSVERFNTTTLADAQKKLDDANQEYTDKKQEAETQITDGEKKLADGQAAFNTKIAEAEQKLTDSQKQLTDAKNKLAKAQTDSAKELANAKKKLTEGETQYAQAETQYNNAKLTYDTQIEQAQQKLTSARTEYNNQYLIFYSSTKPNSEMTLTLMKTAIDGCNEVINKTKDEIEKIKSSAFVGEHIEKQLNDLNAKLTEYQTKLAEYQKQYDDGKKQLAEGEKKLFAAKTELDTAQELLNTKKADGAKQLTDAQNQLNDAKSKLDSGKFEYDSAVTNGMLEMQAAQQKITDGEKQLADGKAELEKQKSVGLESIKLAREKLIQGKYDAKVGLETAEQKLKDAEHQISLLKDAKWYVYDRTNNAGYSGLREDAQRVDNVAVVFPVFFVLVAVLVCLTTMTRMVEERRTEIGTLKALGYSKRDISAKYIIYALLAALTGSIVGGVIGVLTLPYIIVWTYGIMYILPATKLVVSWSNLLISAGVGIVCTCGVALISCLTELRTCPAVLIRPKAPRPGKRILLEHITPIWKHLNFTSKVTMRNLFRYKARFLMTVIGVAGCTALIVAALGLKDSITVIADRQFKELTMYDQVYALSSADTADAKSELMDEFRADERFEGVNLGYQGWTSIYYAENYNSQINMYVIIGENKDEFEKMFILRDRVTHQKTELTDDGVIITERLSEIIGAGVGDNIRFKMDDVMYNAKISGITENYAGNYVYLSPKSYEKITGGKLKYNTVFASVAEQYKNEQKSISNDWMKQDDIVTVTLISDQMDLIEDTLKALDIIVYVIILSAGLLAVVVLYNLTNINIAERMREIATLKVLGFYNGETANYVYRENIILTVVGAAIGLFFGSFLSRFIIESIQMDMVMFPKEVTVLTYILGFVLTFAFSMLVNWMMYFKMKKISMVESLKSVD